jgi:hypothetical protein
LAVFDFELVARLVVLEVVGVVVDLADIFLAFVLSGSGLIENYEVVILGHAVPEPPA